MTIGFAIVGAGRIGQVHGHSIASNPEALLRAVADPNPEAARALAQHHHCSVLGLDEIATDTAVDAVLICSPTDTHAKLIELFARAGKAIFCEKPIALDVQRIEACLKVLEQEQTPFMTGFHRRFDPHFAALRLAIQEGQIGKAEIVVIISRDPAPPPADYIEHSGGIFLDMMIHDFDMALFLTAELPAKVQACGSVLVDKAIAELDDFDSASAIVTMASGAQVLISNSRRSCYGYDQRIEVHGSRGMVVADNQRPIGIEIATAKGFTKPPLHDFFLSRYRESYATEIANFITALKADRLPSPNGRDGLNALRIAVAARQAAASGKAVPLAR